MIDRMQLIKEEMLRDYIRKQLRNQDQLVEQQENVFPMVPAGASISDTQLSVGG